MILLRWLSSWDLRFCGLDDGWGCEWGLEWLMTVAGCIKFLRHCCCVVFGVVVRYLLLSWPVYSGCMYLAKFIKSKIPLDSILQCEINKTINTSGTLKTPYPYPTSTNSNHQRWITILHNQTCSSKPTHYIASSLILSRS